MHRRGCLARPRGPCRSTYGTCRGPHNSVKKSITNPTTEAKPIPPNRKRIIKKSADPSFTQKKENALIAITDAEQSKDIPKPISTKEEKHLNVMSNVIINSIKKSKKRKELLALTDANPPMDIKKLLSKKDNEKTLMLY